MVAVSGNLQILLDGCKPAAEPSDGMTTKERFVQTVARTVPDKVCYEFAPQRARMVRYPTRAYAREAYAALGAIV